MTPPDRPQRHPRGGQPRDGRRDSPRDSPRDPGRARPGARKTPRGIAHAVLTRVDEGAFAHLALPEDLRRTKFSTRDRGFVTEMVYGTLREQRSLDRALRKHCRRPLDELEPGVERDRLPDRFCLRRRREEFALHLEIQVHGQFGAGLRLWGSR